MESGFFLAIVVLLMVLAIFDLIVGVSNDAVNFLTSAIGAKVASFKVIIFVATVGIMAGAASSNGMMDVARHGIISPEYYSFYDVVCLFVSVMLTDIILLDLFNTLGMPTSTTVSLVFELLGGAFAVAIIKIYQGATGTDGELLTLGDLINTSKALTCIVGIFLSVAIAFICGTVVMWLSRIVFTFSYSRWVWWVSRCIVIIGTGFLAFSFASNDMVNFLGVPLTGLDAYTDFVTNGEGNADDFMMKSLMGSAQTPTIFLLLGGMIMVLSLNFSKKAQNVVKTSVDLSRRYEGDEMFGSSAVARLIVRNAQKCAQAIASLLPARLSNWIDSRFNNDVAFITPNAAFDHIRAAVNLVLAAGLVAFGTKMKLPLSTTYVTFMVAMGTSLADRAWSRESAVFRVTGVISVIGGWFITAGSAFVACFLFTIIILFGGTIAIAIAIGVALIIVVKNNLKFTKNKIVSEEDVLFKTMMQASDKSEKWNLLKLYVRQCTSKQIHFVEEQYHTIVNAFLEEEYRPLKRAASEIEAQRKTFKRERRKQIIGLQHIDPILAVERNSWFFLANNAVEQMLYCLKRINDPCREHIGNNFTPVSQEFSIVFIEYQREIARVFGLLEDYLTNQRSDQTNYVREQAATLQTQLSEYRKQVMDKMQLSTVNIEATTIFLSMVQETQQLVSNLRHLVRGMDKFEN